MTEHRLRIIAVIAALTAGVAAGRAEDWMDDAALRSTFAGTTIDGVYAAGLTFREQYLASGKVDYREASGRALTGHWSVVAGTFCTIYTIANTGGCFRVKRVSANCYEFYFQTRTEAEAAQPDPGKPSWTARAWHSGPPTTCREAPVV